MKYYFKVNTAYHDTQWGLETEVVVVVEQIKEVVEAYIVQQILESYSFLYQIGEYSNTDYDSNHACSRSYDDEHHLRVDVDRYDDEHHLHADVEWHSGSWKNFAAAGDH